MSGRFSKNSSMNHWAAFVAITLAATTPAVAQPPGVERYYPLNQTVSPGVAGQWAAVLHPDAHNYYQPIQIELPAAGNVTFFGASQKATHPQVAPANAALLVGCV